jgi:DnaJ-class molecular chaperone
MTTIKEVTKCPICTGYGTMLGLGMMERKCRACNGVGYSEIEKDDSEEPITHITEEEMTGVLLSRKRGRPVKQKF